MRWRILVPMLAGTASLLAGSLAASATAATGTAEAPAASAGKTLYAFNTGLVLTVYQKAGRGTPVRVEASQGRSGQRWVFGRRGSIRPAVNEKLCLNVTKYKSGAPLELWTCDGKASERFRTSAPSAHTQVFFVQPAKKTGYCLTTLGDPTVVPPAGDKVGLDACAGLAAQAWSSANLADIAGSVSGSFALQALRPTAGGSAVTGSNRFAGKLDEYWTSSYGGAAESTLAMLHPVDDTALCVSLAGAENGGVQLELAGCDSAAGQQFMGIGMIFNANYTFSFITTPDSRYCVQAAPAGPAADRAIVLGSCVGNGRDIWQVDVDMSTPNSPQYQELYAGNGTLEFSMRVAGTGGAGSAVVLSYDDQAATQIWTDLPPGQAKAASNADGSITLRPLSNESLCLAVPAGDYAAGVQLTVQACDGQVDQEFVRAFGPSGPTDLVAAGSGEFCVTGASGIKAGSPVELEPCAQLADQTWSTFFDWYGWAGQPLDPTSAVADPGDTLVLSGASSTGGQVGVAPSPGPADWYASQDWVGVPIGSGEEIQSVYDPGLCLDAPAGPAGTQLTAAPCAGGSAQTFTFGAADGKGQLWRLGPAGLCVAVGSTSGTSGLPLTLQACAASQADEAWSGPSYQL
jgi:hypothetical protein